MSCLDDFAAKPSRLVVGAMSGTSIDGIDVAVCRITGSGPGAAVVLERFAETPYTSGLQLRLRNSPDLKASEVAELNVLVGEEFADAIAATSEGFGIELIGSHGQTVYHHSRVAGAIKATLQLGDGDVIAERLGLPVVSDFRARDIAAGGEGAPLTPYADFILFGGSSNRAILNLGGVANLTLLADTLLGVSGFDTGPANAPLDRICRAEFDQPMDLDGVLARSGSYDPAVLTRLLDEDSFLTLLPPKSTGIEAYGDSFVTRLRAGSCVAGADLLRLATEYVVESVARQVPHTIRELIVAGGGAANSFLLEQLARRIAPCQIRKSDELGVPCGAREAMAFAILANDAVCGLPTSLPGVTGAVAARRLGKLSWP